MGQDVLGHDVDKSRQKNKRHGGLVDEEEGDELRHGRLEDGLYRLALRLGTGERRAHHLLRGNLGLLALGSNESRARHDRWADHGGLAERGPGEGAEEACGVHRGLCGRYGLAHSFRASIGTDRVLAKELAYRIGVRGPVEMDWDGGR